VKRLLSLHHLTMLHADPFELVTAARVGGFDCCGIRIVPPDPADAVFDLVGDVAMRRRLRSHLQDSGIGVLDVEAIWIRGNTDVTLLAPAMDAAAELGARFFLTVGYDFDRPRLVDSLGRLADLAAGRGLDIPLEFITYTAVTTLADAWEVMTQVGRPNVRILIDSLQFFRAGAEFDLLAALPAPALPYAQLSDGSASTPQTVPALRHEARTSRMIPGEGELDLRRLLATLPDGTPLAVEAPTRELAHVPHGGAAGRLAAATRRLLESPPTRGRTR